MGGLVSMFLCFRVQSGPVVSLYSDNVFIGKTEAGSIREGGNEMGVAAATTPAASERKICNLSQSCGAAGFLKGATDKERVSEATRRGRSRADFPRLSTMLARRQRRLFNANPV